MDISSVLGYIGVIIGVVAILLCIARLKTLFGELIFMWKNRKYFVKRKDSISTNLEGS